MARSEIQAWLEALTRKTKPNSVGGIPPDASEAERSSTGGDHHRLRSAFTANHPIIDRNPKDAMDHSYACTLHAAVDRRQCPLPTSA